MQFRMNIIIPKNKLRKNYKKNPEDIRVFNYLSINQSPKDIATILGTKENKKLAPATIVTQIVKYSATK